MKIRLCNRFYDYEIINSNLADHLINGDYVLDVNGILGNDKTNLFVNNYGYKHVTEALKRIGYDLKNHVLFLKQSWASTNTVSRLNEQDAVVITDDLECYVKAWVLKNKWIIDVHPHD